MQRMELLSPEAIKRVSVDILKYIDTICRKNQIEYFIAFGTLIGAIRHKGFIPWDDDIDICMKIDDYRKFREIVNADSQYRFIDLSTNPDYYFLFGRVTDTGTKLVLPNKPEIHGLGVFVDVFPIYNAPPVEEREEWYRQYAALRQKMLYTVPGTAHYQGPKLKSMVRYAKRIPKRIKYKSRNYSQYCAEITALLNRYENSGTGDVVVMDTPYGLKTVMERKIFESAAEVEFEGGKFLAPVLYEEYLTKLYGDYMKLPPVEKRVSSHGFQAYWNK